MSDTRQRPRRLLHTRCLVRDIAEGARAEERAAVEHAIARRLAEAATVSDAACAVLHLLAEPLRWRRGALWLAPGDAGPHRCAATWPPAHEPASDSAEGAVAAACIRSGAVVRTGPRIAFPCRLGAETLAAIVVETDTLEPAAERTMENVGAQLALVMGRERAERGRRALLERAEAALTVAEAEARRSAFLARLAHDIGTALDLDAVLQTVAEGARDLCASELSAVVLREPETGEMVFRHRVGPRRGPPARRVVEPGRGAGGLVLATGQPVRSEDLPRDPRFAEDADYQAAVARESVVTVMVVPIVLGDGIEGLLYVANRTPRPFTDRDEEILRQLADHAAIAVRNARLLAEEQRARAAAEAANRLKDEFLATLSHELRTPLNAVLGWAVALRAGRLDEPTAARAREAIERNARAQSQLIEDLLDISRIVTGKLRLDTRLVDPIAVVEAAIDALGPAAAAKRIQLHSVLDPRAGPISGDPGRLQQVVWNLLSNAIKFTPPEGEVSVRLSREPAHAEIVVADTGQGIDPALLPHVFERFRQADSSSTRAHGGLGIGLALVKHLAELHGGTVAAESGGPGHGARFSVRLPLLAVVDDVAPAAHPAARPPRFLAVPSLAGVRVLVVDDEQDALDMFHGVLAMAGAEVTCASSTAEGLARLAEAAPDVLVSDIELPGEDGYAFIRKVRARGPEDGGNVPAVAVTAHGSLEDRLRVLAAGFQMHVPKPVEPAELLAVVDTLAARRRPLDRAAPAA
jgi:signal transduction histidine kinase/ActR/RegA family two-component response regulator